MRERSQNRSVWVLCRGTRHTRHVNQLKTGKLPKTRGNNRLLVLWADKMRDICNEKSAWER